MGSKKIRNGKITHIGPRPRYHYETRDGVETLVRLDHVVQLVIEITEGPDAGREVRVDLDTLAALHHSRNVDLARHEAHARDREHEAPEESPTAVPEHEHSFWDVHPEVVCVGHPNCTLTYGEYRQQA